MSRNRSPKAQGQRPLRVGEEIRHALSGIFSRGEIRDPGLAGVSVTVSEVRVSPDLKNATAFVMPLGGRNAEQVLAALARCAPFIRTQVAKQVNLRYAIRIGFRVDDSFEQASRIDALLRRPDVAADLERPLADVDAESPAAEPAPEKP